MSTRPVIDVSSLPESVVDHKSSIWWGNLLLVGIETTMFALLVAGYFYVRQNFEQWPPPLVNRPVAIVNPVPSLTLPTLTLAALLLSLVPVILADWGSLKQQEKKVTLGLGLFLVIGVASIVLRFGDFGALHFRWDDNAYASLAWTITGLHLVHMIVGVLEMAVMLTWVLVKGLDKKHARDIRVTAVYWYWVVGTWIVLYAIVFPGPRFF